MHEALRAEGFDGRVVLIGSEPHPPYQRPPLSKDYLQGATDRDKVFVHDRSWYDDHGIGLRLGAEVTGLDTRGHHVTLSGADLPGVHHLRGDARVVVRGDLDDLRFIAFWLHHGAVVAAMNVNIWDVTDHTKALIRSRRPVDPARLTDPDIPLDRL
ncbi:oxidoreductase C-terminal domain-containing protein [Spirillospora sp. CA-253888]